MFGLVHQPRPSTAPRPAHSTSLRPSADAGAVGDAQAERQQDGGQPERDRRGVEEHLAGAVPDDRRRPHPREQPGHPGAALAHHPATAPPHQHGVDRPRAARVGTRIAATDVPKILRLSGDRERLDRAAVVLAPEERRQPVAADVAGDEPGDDLVGVGPAQRPEQDDQPQHDPGGDDGAHQPRRRTRPDRRPAPDRWRRSRRCRARAPQRSRSRPRVSHRDRCGVGRARETPH